MEEEMEEETDICEMCLDDMHIIVPEGYPKLCYDCLLLLDSID